MMEICIPVVRQISAILVGEMSQSLRIVVIALFQSSYTFDHWRMASITHHADCVGMWRTSFKPSAANSR